MTFKKFILGLLGGAAGFIIFTFLDLTLQGTAATVAMAISIFGGWLVGHGFGALITKETESKKTSGFAKAIIWILVIAIIVVAIVAFLGKSIKF